MDIIKTVIFYSLIICVVGYFSTYLLERKNLLERRIPIGSDNVTQGYLDTLDMTIFRLGKTRLNIGDHIRIKSQGETFKGMILGAKKRENMICILLVADEIKEFSISSIDDIKVTRKYGRIF
jgi:hypothetical protein